MICRHCGREIAEIEAVGSFDGTTVLAHIDTRLTICDGDAWKAGARYFDLERAEP